MLPIKTSPRAMLVTAAALLCAGPGSGQSLNTLTAEEAAAGWKLLFNGASNAGWVHPNGTPGTFLLEENALRNSGGDICTQDDYKNFEFVTDYKYGPGGNSGIFIRCRRGIDPPYYSGVEIAIQDNGQAGRLYKNGDAAVYDVKAPSVDKWTGPDKWNTQRIRVAGSQLTIHHNGERVIDLDMASAEWKSLVAASKFTPETQWPIWGKETQGQICLQDHGTGYKVMFRNIKILPLPEGSAVKPKGKGKAPASGFRFDILGHGNHRRLAVDVPGGRDLEISLLDLSGRDTGTLRIRGPRAELPLRGLQPGIYWLRVVTSEFQAERRVALF